MLSFCLLRAGLALCTIATCASHALSQLAPVNHARSLRATPSPAPPGPRGGVAYTNVSQDRSIAINAMNSPGPGTPPQTDSDFATAPDFDPFMAMADVSVSGYGQAAGMVRQTSGMYPQLISADCFHSGQAFSGAFSSNARCQADSSFFFVFDVATPQQVHLTGSAFNAGMFQGLAAQVTGTSRVELTNVDTNEVLSSIVAEFNSPQQFADFSTTLSPGRYSLHARTMTLYDSGLTAGQASGSARAIAMLTFDEPPPCPADWNNSGEVNFQDYFDFLTAFFSSSADFNDDGTTNSQDYFDFITAFFQGC